MYSTLWWSHTTKLLLNQRGVYREEWQRPQKKNAYDEIECVYCARITYIYIYILMMIYAIQMDWNRKKKLFFSVWYHMRVFLSIAAYAAVLSLVLEFVALVREMLFHQISHDSESELLTKPYLDMNWKMNYLCFNHIFFSSSDRIISIRGTLRNFCCCCSFRNSFSFVHLASDLTPGSLTLYALDGKSFVVPCIYILAHNRVEMNGILRVTWKISETRVRQIFAA